jgi:hypothetical protein
MKQCPTCNRTYADETLTYCLADGSLLSAPYDSEATRIIPQPRTDNPAPTEVLHPNPLCSQQTKQSINPMLIYIIVALLALIVGGGVVALLKSGTKDTPIAQSSTPLPTLTPTTTPKQEQSKVQEEPKIKPPLDIVSSVFVKTLKGDIGYKYKIEMRLRRNGTNLSGTYFYTKYGVDITLTGTIDSYQNIELYGYNASGVLVDVFKGRFISNSEMQGTWSKPDGSKSLPFTMREQS